MSAIVRATRLSAVSLSLGLALAGCSSSSASTTAAASPSGTTTKTSTAATSTATTDSPTTPAAETSAALPSTSVEGAGGDCKKASDAVEAMSSVIAQGGMVTKVQMLNGCDTLKVWTKLTAAQAAVALAICSQLDSPAYAGGAKSVQLATADGSVVLAKGTKGQACTSGS